MSCTSVLASSAGTSSPSVSVPPGHFLDLLGLLIDDVETVGHRPFLEVGRLQEVMVVVADQQRQVGLLAHEGAIDLVVLDQQMNHAQRQGGVRHRLDADPQVGLGGRGVVVRRDGNDLGAAVLRLGEEMRVGNLGVQRIAGPEQDQVGIEVIVGRVLER